MLAQINYSEVGNAIPEFKFWNSKVGEIIGVVIPYVLAAAGVLLLLYLIWGGFSLMTSQGDAKKVQESKVRITNAAIGFVVVFVAYWIVQLIGEVLGIEEIQNIFSG
jgi:hypothetical protein